MLPGRLEVEFRRVDIPFAAREEVKALSWPGGGGVTTRGPGEQKLEYDRRVIRQRMEKIRKRLSKKVRAARQARLTQKKEGAPWASPSSATPTPARPRS